MKSLKQLLSQPPIYLHDWTDKFGVMSDFEELYMSQDEYNAEKAPYANVEVWENKKLKAKRLLVYWNSIDILFASYGNANYSGDAWVLFSENGILYEVNGGHCSCFGLEGQWKPEKVELKELENRLSKGSFGKDDYSDNEFHKQLCEFLGIDQVS